MSNPINITNLSIPENVLIAFGSVTTFLGLLLVTLLFWYLILDNVFRDSNLKRTAIDNLVYQQIITFFILIGYLIVSIVNFGTTVVFSTLYWVNQNIYLVGGLLIMSAGSAIWLEYHNVAVKGWMEFRQCLTRQVVDIIIFPLINMIRFLFNLFIGIWNAIYDFAKFLRTGQFRVIFACFEVNGFLAQLNAFGFIIQEGINDFVAFLELGNGIFTQRWNIQSTLAAGADFLVTLSPIMICFCEILDFLWLDIANMVILPSFNIAGDALFNIFVRILQVPINSILTLSLPQITNIVIEFNVFIVNLGDWLEQVIFLLLETFFQVISSLFHFTMPPQILQIFNAHYLRIISQILASGAIVLNMTVEAMTHFQDVEASDKSGIAYFQFGQIIDRLKDGVAGFSQIFSFLGVPEQCFVRETLDIFVVLLAVILDIIPGAIMFLLLPHCCNNPLNFFVEYWFTPGNNLVFFFTQVEFATQCVRDLLATLNAPFGCSIQHLLNIIVELAKIITQMLIFSFDIITFQPFPTLLDINLDPLFTEFILWCQCTADIITQFNPNFCIPNATDDEQNLVCCTGELLVDLCNIIVSLFKQVIDFVFDIITLPSGTILVSQVRIPNFNDAIEFTRNGTCHLACMITSLIPLNLECISINPNITCTSPQSCAATLLCDVVNGLLIPVEVLNAWLIALRTQGFFDSLFVWIQQPVALITQWIADDIDFLGAFLDCILCVATEGGVNCTDDTYQVTHEIALLLPTIRPFFTSVAMLIIKIILQFIKAFFVDGEPLNAIINAVFSFLSQVVGALGPALVKFIVDLLNRIGLSFLGNFINALWIGLCPTLQFVTNTIVFILNLLTFFQVGISSVNFCCDGNPNCTLEPQKRAGEQTPDVLDPVISNGTLYLTMENWIRGVTQNIMYWNSSDPCNSSMTMYSQIPFTSLTKSQSYDVMFCLMKQYWFFRTDNQTVIMESSCDVLFEEYTSQNINFESDLRLNEQLNVMECIESRLIVDSFRMKTNLTWIPSDFLSNPWRKYIFGSQILRGLSIYFQYFSDRSTNPDNLLKQEYQQRWINAGLNVSYLQTLTTVSQVTTMLNQTTLEDYFEWNNGTQIDAVKWLTLSFWETVGLIISDMMNSIVANADINTSNLTGALLTPPGDSSNALSSTFFGIIYQFLSVAQSIINYWSNPNNLKRYAIITEKVSKYTYNKFQGFIQTLITIYNEGYELDPNDEFLFENNNLKESNPEEYLKLKNEILFRRGSRLNYFYSWYYNHFPKIYKRTPDKYFNYINHMKEKMPLDIDPIYIRTLLINSVYKNIRDVITNRTKINYMLYNLSDIEFNIQLTKYEYKDSYILNEEDELKIKEKEIKILKKEDDLTASDYDKLSYFDKLKTTYYFLTKGSNVSHYKISKIQRLHNHILSLFNDVILRTNIKLKIANMNKLPYDQIKIKETNQPFKIPNEDVEYKTIVYDERNNDYIITISEPDEYKKRTVEAILINQQQQPFINKSDFNITIPACGSNIPFLCQNCYYLDQLWTSFNSSLHHAIDYYLGPKFQINVNMSQAFLNYTSDPFRVALIGGTQNCSVRFPSNMHSNLCYFTDRDPKIGFSDVADFINGLPLPPDSLSVCNNGNQNFFISLIICPIFSPVINFFEKFFFNLRNTSTAETVVFDLFAGIYECDWDTWDELTGVNKRFSIGETGIIFICSVFLFSLGLSALFPSYTGSIFALVFTGTSGFLIFGGYLIFTYSWSYACTLAIPMDLGNDIFNLTAYVFSPKCEVFLSSLINENYTNSNCYACNSVKLFTFANCKNDVGFTWFADNIVFILQYYCPECLNAVRNAPWPVTLLFQIPYFESTINKWLNVNWDDPVQYSQVQACGLGYTFAPNFIILNAILLAAAGLLSPAALAALGAIIANLVLLALLLIQVFTNLLTAIFYWEARGPYVKHGLVDENGETRPPTQNFQTPRQRIDNYFYNDSVNSDFNNNNDDEEDNKRKKKSFISRFRNKTSRFFDHLIFLILFFSNEMISLFRFKKRNKIYEEIKRKRD